MTRPRKQTVDYFPHTCKHGKTMFILEKRYGVHGYAFWFKLLELLGSSEGHFFDCNDPANWEYLCVVTGLESELCTEALELLAKLDAIDSELWEAKVIWSENFVKGVTDAYRNRRVDPPKRPDNYIKKTTSEKITTSSLHVDNHKLNETKLNKTREDSAPPAPGNGDARPQPPAFSCECFEISPEYLKELAVKFPLLPSEYLTKEFFPRMRDWCLDNRKTSKHLKKFDSKGNLKNPRSCFSKWLKNEDPVRASGYMEAPVKFYVPPPDTEGGITYDRNCPLCKGHPGSMLAPPGSDHKYDPCTCLHPIKEVRNGAPQATAPAQ